MHQRYQYSMKTQITWDSYLARFERIAILYVSDDGGGGGGCREVINTA